MISMSKALPDDDPSHDNNKQYQHSGYQHGLLSGQY